MKVLVVERNDRVGGGLLTEEATLPGFHHNLHANFMMGLELTPFYTDLDLPGLGLELIFPDVQHGIAFPDGTAICIHRDPEKTAASIARFSQKDSDRYWEVYEKFTLGTRDYITSSMFNCPLPPAEIAARLNGDLWFHSIALENDPGTGAFFPRVHSRMDRFALVKGGSGRLAEALAERFRSFGGEIIQGDHVSEISHKNGKVMGIRLEGGDSIEARQAVVSTVDPPQTLRMVGDDGFGTHLSEKVRNFKPSPHALCTIHLALNEPPQYSSATFDPDINRAFNIFFGVADERQLEENFEATKRGDFPPFPMGNGACNTLFDPSYAPTGKHTAFWWPFVPYELKDGGSDAWDIKRPEFTDQLLEVWRSYAPNLDEKNVLGTFLFTPRDTERSCINMIRGSHHVGAYTLDQVGYNRPTPELSHYRTPVEGVYMAGSGNHVGGSISGAAGYNAANVIADDLELDKWWTPVPEPVLA
jgi:phytoene dehydrogenase-like protein